LYQKLSFDPHEILGVSKDADEKAIRKSYRKLSMTYHPDKNKTEEARVIYTKVRRAYKMLADPEAFEEELQNQPQQSGDISVALPRFLLDPEYRKFAAPLLLGTLFLFPIALIWMLMRGSENDEILREVIDQLIWLQEQYDSLYKLMGEPENCANAKPEDLSAAWTVDPIEYEVGAGFVHLCNDSVTRQMERLFPIIRQDKRHGFHFAQYRTLHENKQALLLQMKEGSKPAKQMAANLQAFNKRIQQTLEVLRPGDGRVPMEGPVEDNVPPANRKELRSRKGK
jgi:curved DNA-binding protein CbpA